MTQFTISPRDSAIRRVHSFWFGQLDGDGCADEEHSQRWYKKDSTFDQTIHDTFLSEYDAIAKGGREHWLQTLHGRLVYVIVLDQFSRNMFRESKDMFAHDGSALRAALEAIKLEDDRALAFDEKCFLYLPLMHAEDLDLQDRCVDLFTKLKNEVSVTKVDKLVKKVENSLDFAKRHRNIIERFGRFPHRNVILGRTSTAEEIEFLKSPGSSF